jgi:RNA ligase (TIGR02306 family)
MSEWLPQVVRIQKIEKHPNADTLSIATIMNEYPVVIKTDQYQVGDLVSYISADSIVPDIDMFSFLAPPPKKDEQGKVIVPSPTVGSVPLRSRTIRAKKIRGIYSEGLIVAAPPSFQEGDSIVDFFNLTKREYEEELPEKGSNDNEFSPKTFSLFKYDLEAMAKYGYLFKDGEQVIITEKIEGENCAVVYTEDKLWVRSRNYFKRNVPGSHWWDIPNRLELEEKLKLFQGYVIWFELYGSVKHFKYDCPVIDGRIQLKGRIFDIWDLVNKRFLPWDNVEFVAEKIGMETVPVLYKGGWKVDRSLHELAEGQSTIGTCVREGWVMRSVPESWDERLGRKILKLKGRGYKLFKD